MVLLRVELENNDEKIKFENHGILNKNKNTLIYDDNKTKTCVDFNNNILINVITLKNNYINILNFIIYLIVIINVIRYNYIIWTLNIKEFMI